MENRKASPAIVCNVFMLPNPERDLPEERWGEWKITLDNKKLDFKKYVHSAGYDIFQHLYFTSDEEIKEGDWIYCNFVDYKYAIANVIAIGRPMEGVTAVYTDDGGTRLLSSVVKIIAATDASLGMPLIPIEWIRDVFIPANGKIDSVLTNSSNTSPETMRAILDILKKGL